MHEILAYLDGGYVLDLGSRFGSFDPRGRPFSTVRVDLDPLTGGSGACLARADAARLPFCDKCFAAVISNHSLEHGFLRSRSRRNYGDGSAVSLAGPGRGGMSTSFAPPKF